MRDTIVTAIYAAVVIWTAAHHEPWRDEVVPLSIARQAGSLAELVGPLRSASPHPVLWYLVLWGGYSLVEQTWVLKVASIGSAVAAIFLLNRSPLPWWLRYLFTFSFFPIYQYSVVSRGYSLQMLVLFTFCALYPRRREHPVVLAGVLAALANTEGFGLVIAVAAGAMLVVDGVEHGPDGRRALTDRWVLGAVALYVTGLAVALAIALPSVVGETTERRAHDVSSFILAVGRAVAQPAAHATPMTVLPVPSLWMWGYFAYLARRPSVLCFAAVAIVGIEALFNLVTDFRAPWQIGNVMLVLVAALWLDAARSVRAYALPRGLERARLWIGRLVAGGALVLFADQVLLGARDLRADLQYDYSANRRLADLLRGDPALADAVVMGEPDAPLWSLPYYADNRIYLAREGVFRAWGSFKPPRAFVSDLGALLGAARAMRKQCECPVVVTIGWPLAALGTHTSFADTAFEERFVITAGQRVEFLAATRLLASLGQTITDESYEVYVLR